MVQQRAGIVFPDGTSGVRLSYFGDGIDPLLFASIRIPESAHQAFLDQLRALPDRRGDIVLPSHIKVPWWGSVPEDNVVLTRLYDHEGNGVKLRYCREAERWILYVLWIKV
jgi:hypothetical protein